MEGPRDALRRVMPKAGAITRRVSGRFSTCGGLLSPVWRLLYEATQEVY